MQRTRGKVEVVIDINDTAETLHDKLQTIAVPLLMDTLPSIIEGTNKREKQNTDEVTFAYNIKREEEHIDFNKTSREVFNLIRGLSPVPSSNAILDENEMKILESKIGTGNYSGTCGEIVDITKEGIVVKTNDGSVVLKTIKPFGKKMMNAKDYVNGIGKDNLIGKVFK